MGGLIVCGTLVVLAVAAAGFAAYMDLADHMRRKGNMRRHREARDNMRGTYLRVHHDGSTTFDRVIRDWDEVDDGRPAAR